MNRTHNYLLRCVVIFVIYLLGSIANAQIPTNSLESVNLRLVWKHQFQFAGYYIAKEKGFYKREGLDVHIHEFDFAVDNLQAVLQGQTDFAVGRSSLLIDKARGHDVVALFAAFQASPFMLLTRAFDGIDKPQDLKGRRLMMTDDAERSGELQAMLIKSGVLSDDYIAQQHSFNVQDLIDGNTDAMASYVSNEPFTMLQQKIPFNILHPADHGFKMYADIAYTSGDKLRNNPQQVEKFYRASIEGWKYAFANIPETVELIFEKYNSQNRSREALLYEGQQLKRLAFDERDNFGTLTPYRFSAMSQVYLVTGAINSEPDLKDFIFRPPSGHLNLSYDEISYIKTKKAINFCAQQDWPPLEHMQDGQHQGIIAEILKLIRDRSGLSLSFTANESASQALTLTRQGICDLTLVPQTEKDEDPAILVSDQFLNIAMAHMTVRDDLSISQLNQRIMTPDHLICHLCLQKRIADDQHIPVDNMEQGIQFLRDNKGNSLFGAEAHLRLVRNLLDADDLHIDTRASISTPFSFAVNSHNPELLGIINKAVATISPEQRERILSRWFSLSINGNGHIDPGIFWGTVGFILIIALFFLYRYHQQVIRNKIVQELSETDQLTGVPNRRKILDYLKLTTDVSTRYGNPLCLIFFDIDNFKSINDQKGHDAGDLVLKALGKLVSGSIRKADMIGRWGGEEFIMISPESSLETCHTVAENLRSKIQQHDFGIGQIVTCSFGITQYQTGESIEHFVHRADSAMYEAKFLGKNRIIDLPPDPARMA